MTPWTAAHQASLSFIISQILLKLMSIELIMLSIHLIPCHPLLLLPSIFPSIRVFSNESALSIRWPKYWSFSFSSNPSNEYWWLISSTTAAAAKSLQSCPILCNTIDGGPPGSPVPGILQARTLEWVTISFSNAWKWKVKVKSLSHVRLFATPWTAPYQPPLPVGFSRQVLEWVAIAFSIYLIPEHFQHPKETH